MVHTMFYDLVASNEQAHLHAGVGEPTLREIFRALHEENHLQDSQLWTSRVAIGEKHGPHVHVAKCTRHPTNAIQCCLTGKEARCHLVLLYELINSGLQLRR